MKTVKASLVIELFIECPECTESIDLINDGDFNDEGQIIKQACPDHGIWSEEHKRFEETIICPYCKQEIDIKGIDWG